MLELPDAKQLLNWQGENGLSTVFNNLLDMVIAIAKNRLKSIINEQLLTQKINTIVNHILEIVPEDIELGNSTFYLEGLLYSDLVFIESSHV